MQSLYEFAGLLSVLDQCRAHVVLHGLPFRLPVVCLVNLEQLTPGVSDASFLNGSVSNGADRLTRKGRPQVWPPVTCLWVTTDLTRFDFVLRKLQSLARIGFKGGVGLKGGLTPTRPRHGPWRGYEMVRMSIPLLPCYPTLCPRVSQANPDGRAAVLSLKSSPVAALG